MSAYHVLSQPTQDDMTCKENAARDAAFTECGGDYNIPRYNWSQFQAVGKVGTLMLLCSVHPSYEVH